MSHFTVVVFGDNWEEQLALYDENLEVEPYWSEDDQEEVTCNPKSKWDWYTMGGRWRGYFPINPDATGTLGEAGAFDNEPRYCNGVDQARLDTIDFEAARRKAEDEARKLFSVWRKCLDDSDVGSLVPWSTLRKIKNLSGELAHIIYNGQGPIVKAMATEEFQSWTTCLVEDFGFDEEAYVKSCTKDALVPYAVVIGGHWIGKGRMGWFGVSHDERAGDEWSAFVNFLYRSLPGDTMVTLVDCHI